MYIARDKPHGWLEDTKQAESNEQLKQKKGIYIWKIGEVSKLNLKIVMFDSSV